MPRTILHVDMDAFYASVEQRENPALRGKPVIVGADPKRGKGRGVVVSCSYEARQFGIHSAIPISRAYQLCPKGVYIPPNFPLYERVSKNVMKIIRRFGDKFEPVSIDEAYLDATQKLVESGDAESLAMRLKREIYNKEGLTCSLGVGTNMLIAKIASDHVKPYGLTIVHENDVKRFLEPLPVSKIPGVGKKTQSELGSLGVETIGQLAKVPLEKLVSTFGKNGVWMWNSAKGIDEREVEEEWTPKSLGAETTFEYDTGDRTKVADTLTELVDEVHGRILTERQLFKTVELKIRFEDFETYTRAKSLLEYTDSKQVLINRALELLKDFENDERKVRLLGVRVSKLRRSDHAQQTLAPWAK